MHQISVLLAILILTTIPASADEGPMLEVRVSQGQIKVTENEQQRVLATVKSGTFLWALETNGDFYRVVDPQSNQKGWIWNRHASPMQSSAADEQALTEAKQLITTAADHFEKQEFEQARDLFQRALMLRRKVLPPNHPLIANTLNDIGASYDNSRDSATAESFFLESMEIRSAIFGDDHPDTIQALRNLALVYKSLNQSDKAEPLYQRALSARTTLLGDEDSETAQSVTDLARLFDNTGRSDDALPLYERALKILENVYDEDNADVAQALHNLALSYDRAEENEEAEPLYQRALEMRTRMFGEEHVDTATSIFYLGWLHDEMKDYEKAEPLYKRALEIRRKLLSDEDPDTAQTVLNLALLYDNTDRYQLAEPLYRESLEIRTKLFGEEHEDTAQAMYNLAWLYDETGRDRQAAPLYQQSLEIRERRLGDDHEDTVHSVIALGLVFAELQDYVKAEPLLKRALEARKKLQGDEHTDTADAYANLGWFYDTIHEYEKAEELIRQSLEINRKLFGENHENTAQAYASIAGLYFRSNDYAKAEPLFQEALNIREKVFGAHHSNTALSLNNLGSLYHERGDYTKAETLFKRALTIRESLNDNDETISTLDYLGWNYDRMGEYSHAEPVFRRALEISTRLHGEAHIQTASCEFSLGALYGSIGEYAKAESLMQSALETREQFLGKESEAVADSLVNLGWLYTRMDQHQKAESFFQRAADIYTEVHGANHPSTSIALINQADVLQETGNFEKAEELLLSGLRVHRDAFGNDHPRCSEILRSLGTLYQKQGNPQKAEKSLKESLASSIRLFGEEHPSVADDYDTLSIVYVTMGNLRQATQLREQSRRSIRRHMARMLPGLSEKAQQTYLVANFRPAFTAALSLGLDQKEDSRTATLSAGWLLNGKSVAQEVLAEAALLSSTEVAPLVSELRQVRDDIAKLTIQKSDDEETRRRVALANLETRQQQLQKQIADHGLGLNAADPWISASTLQGRLPFDSVFVNIARFEIADVTSLKKNRQPPRYAAWVIPAAGLGDIQVIDLGTAEPIDSLVATLQQNIKAAVSQIPKTGEANAESTYQDSVAELSKAILQPLEPLFTDVGEIIISPDGELWNVPWNALLMQDGRYLVEQYRTRYVLSGRELVSRLPERAAISEPVLFADPNFDLNADRVDQSGPDNQHNLRSVSSAHFPRLAATAAEAASIKPSVEGYTHVKARVLMQDAAQEAAFKNLHRPRVLLLSTHGYFEVAQQTVTDLKGNSAVFGNPLLRCGLALAGCNNRATAIADGKEDGILTGLEIIGTDLRGTELVVLSACETGLGDIRNGEGVAGLRQAFQLAGAQSVVSSLWKVEDNETAFLMSLFFKNLADGMNKSEALRQAQLTRIKVRRERFGAAHPFFWAAFTVTGD